MTKTTQLAEKLKQHFPTKIQTLVLAQQQVTIEVAPEHLLSVCTTLRDHAEFKFEQLIDLAGVDYLSYGESEWATTSTTETGFSRAVEEGDAREHVNPWNKPRFAVVYHLLSLSHNIRLRVRCFCSEEVTKVPSVNPIWNSANWFEREAFDLFGILFEGHPDLRRILTDYGFIGYPFRKDFPISGHVEMRYDAKQQRVVYEPVDIEPRVLVPKTIRADNRYPDASVEPAKGATNG